MTEYGIGAVTPGDGVYIRSSNGLTDEQIAPRPCRPQRLRTRVANP